MYNEAKDKARGDIQHERSRKHKERRLEDAEYPWLDKEAKRKFLHRQQESDATELGSEKGANKAKFWLFLWENC